LGHYLFLKARIFPSNWLNLVRFFFQVAGCTLFFHETVTLIIQSKLGIGLQTTGLISINSIYRQARLGHYAVRRDYVAVESSGQGCRVIGP
jgi:hypothetical protein